jgi:hypothetical protein
MSIMDITVPAIPMVIIMIFELIFLPAITYAIIWYGVPDLLKLWACGVFHNDLIIEANTAKMIVERGVKEDHDDILYAFRGSILRKRKPVRIDSTKWDPENVTRWGHINVRFYYPGKAWPKTIPRMAATQVCLELARTMVKKVDEKAKGDSKAEGEEIGDPKQLIKHNELLCLIAHSNPAKALTLLKCQESEIEQYARQFIVIPDSEDKERNIIDKLLNKQDPGTVKKLLPLLVEEVFMVRTACAITEVEPQYVALPNMMHAYPDLETSSELMNKVEDRFERKAKARAKGLLSLWCSVRRWRQKQPLRNRACQEAALPASREADSCWWRTIPIPPRRWQCCCGATATMCGLQTA